MVLPFSSVCLSYAWAIACGGWPCCFSLRTSSLVVPACLCGSFLMRRSCLFLLFCCSARGRRLLSLLLGFASVLLPAAPAVFRGVSCRRLPFGGSQPFWLQMPVLLLRWSYVCGVCGVFSAALVFSLVLCPSSGACGFAQLPLPQVTLSGFLPFSGHVCLPYCCAGGVGWASALSLCSQCFSYTGWLADVRWVLHPVTGCSHCGCDCSLYGSVVVPYGSPCL